MAEPLIPRRSLADSLRRNMLALSVAPLLVFFLVLAAGALAARHHVTQLITGSLQRLESMIELMVSGDGGLQIMARAKDVAGQVEAYLREHPDVTIEELRRSEVFSRIAIQRVGITGYTALYEAGTGIMRFHPNPDLIDRSLAGLAETLPDWWNIYNAPPEGKEDAGFYEWIEPDQFRTRKYMAVCPVQVPVSGRTLMAAATTYLEEFMGAARIASDLGRAVERELTHYTEAKIHQILLALGLVLGVTLLTLYFLNRRTVQTLIQPIHDLAQAVERFGADPSSTPETTAVRERDDEIGKLARTYEKMGEQIHRQIADMNRARLELARSEARYRRAFEEASIGMSIVSPEGVFLEVNRTLAAMIGYEPSRLIGQAVERFVHPEDREERRRILEDLLSGRIQYGHHERRLLHRDGSVVWTIFHIHLARNPEGQALHFVSLIQNITQRRKAEDELRLARFCIDNAAMGIFRIADDARFLEVNEHACRMLGYNREELLQRTVLDVDPDYTWESFREFRKLLRQTHSAVIQRRLRRKDGTLFPVEITVSFFFHEGEGIAYAFVTDMSGRVQAEQERRKLELQLQQAQKIEAIGTLAGGVAHDFNNILAVIIGNANLLELSEGLSEADRACLRQLLAASGRAKELIKQILAFSRRGTQEKILLNLKPVVKETWQFLKSTLPASIEVRQHIEAHLPALLADPTQMQQVLMNLCTNAAHAMEDQDGGTIEIRLETAQLSAEDLRFQPDTEPGTFLHLTVADTGCGIPPEHLNRIFDPYFTTKPAGKGTGLGLAVVHGIVKNHGGFLRVYSEPEKGTEMHIFLPAAETLPSTEPLTPAAREIPRGSGTVLFVDDEPALVELGRHMLAHLGYTPEPRTSPLEALAAFRANPEKFTAVVTDMTMPHMNGMSLAKEILQIRPHTPIVLCTGFSDKTNEEKARGCGIQAFLYKPLTMNDLAQALRKITRSETSGNG